MHGSTFVIGIVAMMAMPSLSRSIPAMTSIYAATLCIDFIEQSSSSGRVPVQRCTSHRPLRCSSCGAVDHQGQDHSGDRDDHLHSMSTMPPSTLSAATSSSLVPERAFGAGPLDGISNGGKRSRSAGAGEPVRKGDAKSQTNTVNDEADIDYVDQNIYGTKQYKRYYFEYASDDDRDGRS